MTGLHGLALGLAPSVGLLQAGSVLYIDDLFVGNRGNPGRGLARAFVEYRQRSRWRFVRHLDIGWWGRSYIASETETDLI